MTNEEFFEGGCIRTPRVIGTTALASARFTCTHFRDAFRGLGDVGDVVGVVCTTRRDSIRAKSGQDEHQTGLVRQWHRSANDA